MPDVPADAPADDPAATGRPATPIAPGPASPAPTTTWPPVGAAAPDTGYTTAGVPTLEGVRDKIESRFGTALGATELAAQTPEARSASERYAQRQQAAAAKLEEIRTAMHQGEHD